MAKYEYDTDLEFLKKCRNEELQSLFDILVFDKDGIKRTSEQLTNSASYKRYGKNFRMYWDEIAGELQHYGGNTIANVLRQHGIEYEEILDDVMEKLNLDTGSSVEETENILLEHVFEQMVKDMSIEQKMKLAKELGLKELNLGKASVAVIVQGIIKIGGSGLTKLALMIAGYISKIAVGKIAMAGAGKAIGVLTGPIGWGITGVWTLFDIASPAMRVTIPASVMVSCLRKIVKEREKNKDYIFLNCPDCGAKLRIRRGSSYIKCPNCEGVFAVKK